MDTDRFDRVAREVSTSPSRRGVLNLGLGGLLAALLGLQDAEARKRKGKGKNKKKPAIKPKATCAERCGETAEFCASRADAPTLCAEFVVPNCNASCSSDQDCLGTSVSGIQTPYCVTAFTVRSSGLTALATDALVCPNANGPGVCFSLVPPQR